MLIIGAVEFRAVVDVLYPAQRQLAREINPKVYSVREWRNKLREKDPFVTDVLAKPKIFLAGGDDELAELGGRKS
jgi:hypothetical protein